MKVTNKTIFIRIPIEIDEYLKSFIFNNINYRRKVWNDFVEESNKFKGDNCMYDNFKPLNYKTEYFQKEETDNIYNKYCVGISEQVAKDINSTIKRIRAENRMIMYNNKINHDSKKLHNLHFKSFDKYFGSFKVHNKTYITLADNISSRLHVSNANTLLFRVRGGRGSHNHILSEILTIHLREPLYKYKVDDKKYSFFVREYKVKGCYPVECCFNELDIKETCFIHKLGKFYIQLSINASYYINKDDIKSRQKKAGIDTGIHNPGMLYNGDQYYRIAMPEKTVRKLHYLERRAKRLQHIMDKKRDINKKRVKCGELDTVYTNNYEKVRYKFRKIWNKIVNIKRNWIYTTCKFIATYFRKICVDRFKLPNNLNIKPNKLKHRYNFINRFHCMFTFNEILKHMCEKYGCEYIESPKDTTRLCSICGHINQHIPLSQRYLVCEECNTIIDRDKNAAKNCYMYI